MPKHETSEDGHLASREQGTTSLEYGILACFIVLAIVAAVGLLGQNVQTTYERVGSAF